MVSTEDLEQRLAQLERQRDQLIADLQAIDGARQDTAQLLELSRQQEAIDGTKAEATSRSNGKPRSPRKKEAS